jgi:hypothetical protein
MPEVTRPQEMTRALSEIPRGMTSSEELVAFCPKCKAFETLWFNGDEMVPTRKYIQIGKRIYHDCGSEEPCRLLTRFQK